MKVENNSINPLLPNKAEGSRPVERQSQPGEASSISGAKDKAELSERARLLAKARVKLAESPDVDMERIERLQQKIREGTFSIPYEELARRLLPHLLDQ